MYSVEWQKELLPYAHIISWPYNKIISNKIDDVIYAEIRDACNHKYLPEVLEKNTIHWYWNTLNPNPPGMIERKCPKRYHHRFAWSTILGNDGYPLYRISTKDDGKLATIQVLKDNVEVDDQWYVSYSPLLLKSFKGYINDLFCYSVKFIK